MSNLVIVNHEDLVKGSNLKKEISEAFGPDGLGVIAIRGIPEWKEMTEKVLDYAFPLAHLPQEDLKELEDETSMFNAGWSHGKEKLGDKPDFAKGSFYFNPLSDNPAPELREAFPWALPPNRWPAKLEGMREDCRRLGQVMHENAGHLAAHIDALVPEKIPSYVPLESTIKNSLKAKGRLLFYFPQADGASKESSNEASWIGWHNDSGFLTCLTPDKYVDGKGNSVDNPDPKNAGLWVARRDGTQVKVEIPKDCLAIQCGECLQISSGGLLVATPHCVRGANAPSIARVSCPCFIDTPPSFPLRAPEGVTREDVFKNTVSQKVPPLEHRWKDGQTFADFLGDTFRSYYEWTTGKQGA